MDKGITFIIISVTILGIGFIGGLIWGIPQYRIYSQDLKGQANLRQQEWEKRILVEEANAEYESAKMYAQAEIERAKGVAEANEIIGESLKGNEVYLKYLMIQTLEDQETQLIYIPTEAGLPILEAGRQ